VRGETLLKMTSDPGDYIGGGQRYSFGSADGTFSLQGDTSGVSVAFVSSGDWWYLNFAPPKGRKLSVGTHQNAARWPFQPPRQPGLDVSGDGRGSNTLKGSFDIKQIKYDTDGQVVSLWATFEQHCEGAKPALKGEIRCNADTSIAYGQPDCMIRRSDETFYIGSHVYNSSGAGQTKYGIASRTLKKAFFISIRNDAEQADSITVQGDGGGDGYTVRYFDSRGAEITSAITSGSCNLANMAVGQSRIVRLEITPNRSGKISSTKTISVTATSTTTSRQDTVKAVLNVHVLDWLR
jgi:hypothetical protein